jgi:hypothetical protein
VKTHCEKFSSVAGTAINMDCTDNIILLLFMGHCLVAAGCCDSTALALSEYAAILLQLIICGNFGIVASYT